MDFRGHSGGILVFWDSIVLKLLEVELGMHSLSCKFKNCDDNFIWMFTRVYEPVSNIDREELSAKLGNIRRLWSDPWCIGGDFNVVREKGEIA